MNVSDSGGDRTSERRCDRSQVFDPRGCGVAYGMPATDARGARTRACFIESGAAPNEEDEALWRARIFWNPMPALVATRIAMLRDEPRPCPIARWGAHTRE